jgi:hypothetical protein
MSDQEQKREIRRMRALLVKMAEMAEHVEQTGSFESGIHNSVKRYNTIVEHLEDKGILPEDIFPRLDEDSDSGQLGAEAKLLSDYLADLSDEEEEPVRGPGNPRKGEGKRQDLGMMVALAPFLEKNELTHMVLKHFTGQASGGEETELSASQGPDLKTIVGLAPHVDSATLGQMVRACLTQQPLADPKMLVALAPHMESSDFSALIREYLPTWFGGQPAAAPAPPAPPAAPAPPEPPREELR